MISYSSLFRFAGWQEKIMMFFGLCAALVTGVALPIMSIVMGDLINEFARFDVYVTANKNIGLNIDQQREDFYVVLWRSMIYLGIIAGCCFVGSFVQMSCWQNSGSRQTQKIKYKYMDALLRQEVGFFDSQMSGGLNYVLEADCENVKDAISDKVGLTIQYTATFFAGFIIAFIKGWKLACMLLICLPFIVGSAAIMGRQMAKMMQSSSENYEKAGAVAEEAFSGIRTIVSFHAQKKFQLSFENELDTAKTQEVKKVFASGLGISAIFFFLYCMYALGFWWGAKLLADLDIQVGTLVNVFMAFLIGAFSLGNVGPNFTYFVSGRVAGEKIFKTIQRKSLVDSLSNDGKIFKFDKEIKFENVCFTYPTKQEPVLNNFTMSFEKGKSIALVGQSGSGKSTCIALLERFYDATTGNITIDGVDVHELNVQSLRKNMGYVGQEPVLFSGTIRENVIMGITATDDQIWNSLQQANATEFVKDLPLKLETIIGEGGSSLSGGQKQRIAIARALIRDPQILLLDEATSALDGESESKVQQALETASKGRTTIVIAHRLSTVINADKIVAMKNGQIIEVGTHQELVDSQGYYYELIKNQQSDKTEASKVSEESMSPATSEKKLHVEVEKTPMLRALKSSKEHWTLLFVGVIAAVIGGGITPCYALIYSEAISMYGKAFNIRMEPDKDELSRLGSMWGLIFLGLAITAAVSSYVQQTCFGYCGEALVRKTRKETFFALLRQKMYYFDSNSVGSISALLSVKTGLLKNLVGDVLGTVLQVTVSLLTGAIIALIAGWKLGLVVLVCVPLVVGSGVYQTRASRGQKREEHKASEVIANIRTVASLGLESYFLQKMPQVKSEYQTGFFYGIANTTIFIVYIVAYIYGAHLLSIGEYDFQKVFRVISTLVFSAMMGGRISSFVPDYIKAHEAAVQVYSILDTKIETFKPKEVVGHVVFENVSFGYPNRKKILRNFCLEIMPKTQVALVGPSGSGKSTIVQLLERFYEPLEGRILIDGEDLKNLDLGSQMALVSQEPRLFAGTVRENICFGLDIPESVVLEAVKDANVDVDLSTNVGERGKLLSGGQKQRVAIARAIIRRPKILLLDEATSALDTESESKVQEALETASKGRTTIVIAHRLNTLKNADKIVQILNGKIK